MRAASAISATIWAISSLATWCWWGRTCRIPGRRMSASIMRSRCWRWWCGFRPSGSRNWRRRFPSCTACGIWPCAPALHFSPETSARCATRLLQLQALPVPQRLPLLLDVLLMLAEDGKAQALASTAQTTVKADGQQQRMEKVLDHMHAHFRDDIALDTLTQHAALSLGAFHRLFKRHAHCTPGAYLARLRIGRACQQLIESELSIAVIAQEAGYRNLAHFNRQFLAAKHVTPRIFRQQYRHA